MEGKATGRSRRQQILEGLEEECLHHCRSALAMSPKVEKELSQRRPNLPIQVLPPPLAAQLPSLSHHDLHRVGGGPERFLFCGRDGRLKGARFARRWFAHCKKKWPHARLHMWSRSVSHLERVLGTKRGELLGDAITLHGWDGGFQRALADADVLLHPTAYDACSLVCMEAIAHGVTVLTSEGNGISAYLQPPLGDMAALEDAHDVVRKIERMWKQRLEIGGEDFVTRVRDFRQQFSLEEHVERLRRALQNGASSCRQNP